MLIEQYSLKQHDNQSFPHTHTHPGSYIPNQAFDLLLNWKPPILTPLPLKVEEMAGAKDWPTKQRVLILFNSRQAHAEARASLVVVSMNTLTSSCFLNEAFTKGNKE